MGTQASANYVYIRTRSGIYGRNEVRATVYGPAAGNGGYLHCLCSDFQQAESLYAYEYLENRFDGRTRMLISFCFLLNRGLSTGISVFAPSIILSSMLGWNIYWTNIFMGGLLLIYI